MGGYFRGWKRKAGIVTLFMATLVTGMWVRSLVRLDVLQFPLGNKKSQNIESAVGQIVAYQNVNPRVVRIHLDSVVPEGPTPFVWDLSAKADRFGNWEWWILGFGVYEYSSPETGERRLFAASYWSLVLPLTALSAWLLLSKRRQLKVVETPTDQVT